MKGDCDASENRCLTDDDFYSYLTRSPATRSLADLENHLAGCSLCKDRLSGLREILAPPTEDEAFPEPTPAEIEETLALIARAKSQGAGKHRFYRVGVRLFAIAASLLLLAGSSILILYFLDSRKAGAFLAEGRSALQQNYTAQSPSGLRLDLPFESVAAVREPSSDEALNDAERFFHQALAMREGLREAHLALGYIHLSQGQFSKAREEFQLVLDGRNGDPQALLSRGASLFEEGAASEDLIKRKQCLEAALSDFDDVLRRNRASNEARYNRILVLQEVDRGREAVKEIDEYVARDPASIWAQRLGNLRPRIHVEAPDK